MVLKKSQQIVEQILNLKEGNTALSKGKDKKAALFVQCSWYNN